MPDRTHTLTTWLFAGLTLFPYHLLVGQEQAYLGDVRKSFAGFPWGATFEHITATRGRPALDTLVRDFRRLVYHDTVEAKPVDVWYLLHPTRGLMAGQIGFQKPDEKCQDGFKRIRQAVERANPGLEKRNEHKRELDVVCSMEFGTRIGTWQLAWGDSGSASISEMMLSGSPRIFVYYKGPDTDAYVAEQVARRGPAIDGFSAFAWGTPRNSILKRLGAPKRTDSTSSTVSLSYLDLLLGERAVLEFTTSPVEGLIKGTYWIPVPAGYDCDLFYRKFYFALIERFPDITPSVIRFNRSGKSFCEGVAKGTAAVTSVWRDPKSEAFVTAELNKPGKMVRISYLGSTYQTWSKRNREADLKGKL